jgi:hypothetical protein
MQKEKTCRAGPVPPSPDSLFVPKKGHNGAVEGHPQARTSILSRYCTPRSARPCSR